MTGPCVVIADASASAAEAGDSGGCGGVYSVVVTAKVLVHRT